MADEKKAKADKADKGDKGDKGAKPAKAAGAKPAGGKGGKPARREANAPGAVMMERFGYSTPMQAPEIQKITLNMGVGDAKQDSNVLDAAGEQLAIIAGQRPNVRRARKSIAQFKVREGMPVGVSVTLRGQRSYEFLDRLMSVAIPRIRDFRGLSPRSFDGRGNYSLGIREQIIFPEIDYDSVDQVRGLDVNITTSAATDEEAFALLSELGMPFSRDDTGGASAAELRQAAEGDRPAPAGDENQES